MDDATIRYFDDGYVGDWVRVEYWAGMGVATVEGEFAGYGRTSRGNWFVHISRVILIPTIDVRSIRVLVHAGCL